MSAIADTTPVLLSEAQLTQIEASEPNENLYRKTRRSQEKFPGRVFQNLFEAAQCPVQDLLDDRVSLVRYPFLMTTMRDLVEDLTTQYEAHRAYVVGTVHGAADNTNTIAASGGSGTWTAAAGTQTIWVQLNAIRAAFVAHMAQGAVVHLAADDTTDLNIAASTANDLWSAIQLANALYTAFTAHEELLTAHTIEDAVNVLTADYLTAGTATDTTAWNAMLVWDSAITTALYEGPRSMTLRHTNTAIAAGGRWKVISCDPDYALTAADLDNVIWVAGNGDDSIGDGSIDQPLATINAAIAAATAGDLLMVAPGNYSDPLTISKKLNIRGSALSGVVVSGASTISASGCVLEGISFTDTLGISADATLVDCVMGEAVTISAAASVYALFSGFSAPTTVCPLTFTSTGTLRAIGCLFSSVDDVEAINQTAGLIILHECDLSATRAADPVVESTGGSYRQFAGSLINGGAGGAGSFANGATAALPNILVRVQTTGALTGILASLGNVFWVSTDGDDVIGDGSIDQPLATIDAAITAATAGDLLMVMSGTYSAALTISKKLNIRGVAGASVVVSGASTISANGCVIEGISFTNTLGISANCVLINCATGEAVTISGTAVVRASFTNMTAPTTVCPLTMTSTGRFTAFGCNIAAVDDVEAINQSAGLIVLHGCDLSATRAADPVVESTGGAFQQYGGTLQNGSTGDAGSFANDATASIPNLLVKVQVAGDLTGILGNKETIFLGPVSAPANTHAAYAGGGGVINDAVGPWTLPLPARTLQYVCSNNGSWNAPNLTVTGTDESGDTVVETILAAALVAGATVQGTQVFSTIVSVVSSADIGAGETLTVQTGLGIGVGGPVAAFDVLAVGETLEAFVVASAEGGYFTPTTAANGVNLYHVRVLR